MTSEPAYFFCGVGGSGMLPLALIVKARGATVAGSDRSFDQGRTPAKFDYIRGQGIALFPQDGSGVTAASQTLAASAAVEDTIPDVVAARRVGAPHQTRPELLAQLTEATGAQFEMIETVNSLFGPTVTTAGLLVGADIRRALSDRTDLDLALIPAETINQDGIFLDDATFVDVRESLPMPVYPSYDFIDVLEHEGAPACSLS